MRLGAIVSDREIDRQLVERAQRGDKRAFELLVEKYQRKLARLLSRFIRDPAEVEDVTQEAFIKAYRALPAFRGDSAFYTWLYRIGINTAKNYLMAMGRRAPTSTEVEAEEAEGFEEGEQLRDINTPESVLLSNEIAQTVNRTIEALPEELRTAIQLREIEGMSYEDIAQVMDCPIGTVRSRIFRAREAIAEQLRPLLGTRKDKQVVGVMKDRISALMDGELDDKPPRRRSTRCAERAARPARPGAPTTSSATRCGDTPHALRGLQRARRRSASPPSPRCSRPAHSRRAPASRGAGSRSPPSVAGGRRWSAGSAFAPSSRRQAPRRPRRSRRRGSRSRRWSRCRAAPTTTCSRTRVSRRACRCRAWRPTCGRSPSTRRERRASDARAGLSALALVLAASAAQAQSPETLAWLRKIHEATQQPFLHRHLRLPERRPQRDLAHHALVAPAATSRSSR